MVGYYYKTGTEIHEIICFMEEKLKLSCVASPSSLKTGQTYGWKPYRFSFFLNERREIVYTIEPLSDDETDYEQLAKRCQSKEEKKMTKEEALNKIEELKAFVEKLDSEIPEMPYDENSTHRLCLVHPTSYDAWQECGKFQFGSDGTRECYRIKAFELAHLMYAREHLGLDVIGGEYDASWVLYFDKNLGKYQLSRMTSVMGRMDCTSPYTCGNKEDALKIMQYMNKYVKDKIKELY